MLAPDQAHEPVVRLLRHCNIVQWFANLLRYAVLTSTIIERFENALQHSEFELLQPYWLISYVVHVGVLHYDYSERSGGGSNHVVDSTGELQLYTLNCITTYCIRYASYN